MTTHHRSTPALITITLLATSVGIIGLDAGAAHASVLATYAGNCQVSRTVSYGSVSLSVNLNTQTINGVMRGSQTVRWSAPRRVHVVIAVGRQLVVDVVQASGAYHRRISGPGTCITGIRITGSLSPAASR